MAVPDVCTCHYRMINVHSSGSCVATCGSCHTKTCTTLYSYSRVGDTFMVRVGKPTYIFIYQFLLFLLAAYVGLRKFQILLTIKYVRLDMVAKDMRGHTYKCTYIHHIYVQICKKMCQNMSLWCSGKR